MTKSRAPKKTAQARSSDTSPPQHFPDASASSNAHPSPQLLFYSGAPTSSSASPVTPPHLYPHVMESSAANPSMNTWHLQEVEEIVTCSQVCHEEIGEKHVHTQLAWLILKQAVRDAQDRRDGRTELQAARHKKRNPRKTSKGRKSSCPEADLVTAFACFAPDGRAVILGLPAGRLLVPYWFVPGSVAGMLCGRERWVYKLAAIQ